MKPLTLLAPLAISLFLCLPKNDCTAQERSKAATSIQAPAPADFVVPASSIIDSNTNAVILSDIGSIHFVGNKQGDYSYVFTKKTIIKIINKKAFNLANVIIPLQIRKENANIVDARVDDRVDNVLASTFNLENGRVVETKLDKKDILQDRKSKHRMDAKFTMPAVKEGSLIQYTYTITSDNTYSLPAWEFQSIDYPCLKSELEVTIPQVMFYTTVKQGLHNFTVDKADVGRESYQVSYHLNAGGAVGTVAEPERFFIMVNTTKHRWEMKDIPALQVENFLSTPQNYIDKIEFQLSGVTSSQEINGVTQSKIIDVTNTWAKANKELLEAGNFGLPIRENNNWLRAYADKATDGVNGPLDNAKAIYQYVTGHFTCNNYYDPYITTTLQDVVNKNSGTVGDINLLLIALLRLRSITADPVLLSTRENGFNLVQYPILERLNYVIARVSVDGRIFYLDAAHPQLGFGQLADNCYNGHARIISKKDSGSVYFEADSLKEKKTTMVMITPGDNGGLEGSFQTTLGKQESYKMRVKVSTIGEKEYFKNIQTSYGDDLDISNGTIDSLTKREDPVTVRYEFRLKASPGASLIYLNPILEDSRHQNPFTAAERRYPVEMDYAIDELFNFNMQIPEGYVVDEIPKSAKVALSTDQGLFEYLVVNQGSMIQLRCHLKLNRAQFPPEDYASLRDFFKYVVNKESEQIVLKKK